MLWWRRQSRDENRLAATAEEFRPEDAGDDACGWLGKWCCGVMFYDVVCIGLNLLNALFSFFLLVNDRKIYLG